MRWCDIKQLEEGMTVAFWDEQLRCSAVGIILQITRRGGIRIAHSDNFGDIHWVHFRDVQVPRRIQNRPPRMGRRKHWKPQLGAQRETVEQFLARGGQIQLIQDLP